MSTQAFNDYVNALPEEDAPAAGDFALIRRTVAGDVAKTPVSVLRPAPGGWCLAFDQANVGNVDHGYFWQSGQVYKEFWFDALIKPTGINGAGYILSSGWGGAHDLLVGVTSVTGGYIVVGEIYDADTTLKTTFNSLDVLPADKWAYIAVTYQNNEIVVIIDGVPSNVKAFTGKRKTIAGYTDGQFWVGGSDHNMFTGEIAALRVIEARFTPLPSGDRPSNASFRPPISDMGNAFVTDTNLTTAASLPAHFVADYRTKQLTDLSSGLPVGTLQVETVTAAGTVVGNGNGKLLVTARGFNGGAPYLVNFAVTNGNTPATWAPIAVAALSADPNFSNFFTALVSGTTISIQPKLPSVHDSSMNLEVDNDTVTGITHVTTSTHTTPGYLVGNIKHNGYLSETNGGASGVGSMIGQANSNYNRDPSKYPKWVYDPFTFSTAAAPKTPIASTRIYDSFGRADVHYGSSTALGLGTTEVGAKTWTAPNFGILNGNAFTSGSAGSTALLPDSAANATVILRRPNSGGYTSAFFVYGLYLRFVDNSNWLLLQVDATGGYWLYQAIAGTVTNIGAALSFGTGWGEMKGVCTGTTIQIYKDGGSVFDTCTTTLTTSVQRGFLLAGASLRVSEFGVI